MKDYDLSKTFNGVVRESSKITDGEGDEEVRHIVIEVKKAKHGFEEGKHIGVLVPGPHEFGNPYHFRLYSIAGIDKVSKNKTLIDLCVKRCFYIDDYNGEEYKGIASNYLCDLRPKTQVLLTGPYGDAFNFPRDSKSNLLMIAQGTGIAPFRAFIQKIYQTTGTWKGQVRLFYGAKTGMEMLYMNDKKGDLINYYKKRTFKAFKAISPNPQFNAPIALDQALLQNSKEAWSLLLEPNTYVYVAGVEKMIEPLNKALIKIAGSPERWEAKKEELIAEGRWSELLY